MGLQISVPRFGSRENKHGHLTMAASRPRERDYGRLARRYRTKNVSHRAKRRAFALKKRAAAALPIPQAVLVLGRGPACGRIGQVGV